MISGSNYLKRGPPIGSTTPERSGVFRSKEEGVYLNGKNSGGYSGWRTLRRKRFDYPTVEDTTFLVSYLVHVHETMTTPFPGLLDPD